MSNWLEKKPLNIDFNVPPFSPAPDSPYINDIFSVVELLNHQLDRANVTPTRFEAGYAAEAGNQVVTIKASNEQDEAIAALIIIDQQGRFDIAFPYLPNDELSVTGASYGLLMDVLEDGLFGSLPDADRHLFERFAELDEEHNPLPVSRMLVVA